MMRSSKSGIARVLVALLVIAAGSRALHSGGVLAVAGPSGFNPSVVGRPITWANATLSYYTDLGDLSPLLPQTAANDFVADAFSRWTSAPATSLIVSRAGALAEDVNGSNVFLSSGTLTIPADIQPSATNRPLGVVYDADGTVTDALLGTGAGASAFCSTNSVYGGADAYTLDAHFAHALIVLNGNCMQQSADLANVKYRLVRITGRILGVGWSQLNDNVRTGSPAPSSDDLAGFPVMHPRGPLCNGPIAECVPNPDQLRMDDRAAIAYLYPAPGTPTTARLHGSIYFSDERGLPGQPMQGVNVVARLLDPVTGQPSHIVAAASVSGFLFRGSNGNPVTGFQTAEGEPFAKFGSDNMALRGFFDLNGLEIPPGLPAASYQITLEPLNPLYKADTGVGAYRYGSVAPSGSVAPIVISNITAGSDLTQNIVIPNSARMRRDAAEPNSFTAPSPVPTGGSWWAALSDYGDSDFYYFHVRAGRNFHLRVTALDEAFTSTTQKAQPALGIWDRAAALYSAPLLRSNPFNTAVNGQTRINAALSADADLMFGIADLRGEGRPDFRYHARLLYADSLTPARIPAGSVAPVTLAGYGFDANTSVKIGGANAPILARTASRLLLQPPALGNGTASIEVTDLATGDITTITNGVDFGVVALDQIQVLAGGNPPLPVGAVARNPMRVRVTASDGLTPVPNAAVTYTATPAQSIFVECGANPCVRTTDSLGEAAATLYVQALGENDMSASIANGAHVEDALIANAPTSSIYAAVASRRVPMGSTVSIPISVRVLSAGNPVTGQSVNFSLGTTPSSGTAQFAASSVVTNIAGDAANTVNVTALGSSFTVLACLPGNTACAAINILAILPANLQVQLLAGGSQLLPVGQTPAQMVLRVTDGGSPNQPIKAAPVTVATSVFARPRNDDCALQNTDCHPASVRPIATTSATLLTDDNGLLFLTPVVQSQWGNANLYVMFSVGSGAGQTQQTTLQIFQ